MGKELFEELFSLKNSTALITGGYRGIGRLFADTYAEAGANVALAARNLVGCQQAAREISERFGVKTIGKVMDVRNSAQVDQVVVELVEEFGRIDILVNSAGVAGSQLSVLEMSDEDMDEVMNIDFRGIFLVCRAVARYMARNKRGRIINVSSMFGKIAASNISGYCASKAAVIHLTRVMALELIRDNIQVNVLCPGFFYTDLNRDLFQSEAGKKMVKKMIPINRVGDLEELRSTALYLATAPAFLTGSEIYIDGGQSIA